MRIKIIILIFFALIVVSALVPGSQIIIIKGSDTMVRLGQRLADEYMRLNPGTIIKVSGGGSQLGIAALFTGTTDICEASRDMNDEEYETARQIGLEPVRIPIALDGIVIFVNKANPVVELSYDQLESIYTGIITNWKIVGGNDACIVPYSRESVSGTYDFFKNHVFDGSDYSRNIQSLPSSAAIVNAVARDINGIGFSGLTWVEDVKYVAVKKDDTLPAILPSHKTVSAGRYPLSRELYWFIDGNVRGEIKKLVNWALSREGQRLAEELDYVPLSEEQARAFTIR
jgi:phosphate transport system substrate-binding protein